MTQQDPSADPATAELAALVRQARDWSRPAGDEPADRPAASMRTHLRRLLSRSDAVQDTDGSSGGRSRRR
ncbi:hypothetical protein [Embleya sp. AB8]|uniref:hypothetical protein n=1 Tax=Embleya sp. AB8 TaxID=3156304 RepID=UPI003C71DA76